MYYGNGGYGNPYQQQQILQNRLNQLDQQYNGGYYQGNNYQQNMQMQQTNQLLKGRPVSSYDEAKASMIDLDGSLYVFTDIANKKIYTKQIMLDGTADLKTYVLQPQKTETEIVEELPKSYVLVEDFERTIGELKSQIKNLKGGVKNDATGNNANVSE